MTPEDKLAHLCEHDLEFYKQLIRRMMDHVEKVEAQNKELRRLLERYEKTPT